jgi:hypothetical protein
MKFIAVLALCFAAALAAPADVEITKSNFENIGVDGYKFEYVLMDLKWSENLWKNSKEIESESKIINLQNIQEFDEQI